MLQKNIKLKIGRNNLTPLLLVMAFYKPKKIYIKKDQFFSFFLVYIVKIITKKNCLSIFQVKYC